MKKVFIFIFLPVFFLFFTANSSQFSARGGNKNQKVKIKTSNKTKQSNQNTNQNNQLRENEGSQNVVPNHSHDMLSQSIVLSSQDFSKNLLDTFHGEVKQDINELLIRKIIFSDLIAQQDWSLFVKRAIDEEYFTGEDFLWVIKENSHNLELDSNDATLLFNIMILEPLENNQRTLKIVDYLSKKYTLKDSSNGDNLSNSLYMPNSRNEYHNIFVQMIENGYLNSLQEILQKWPSNETYFLFVASCKRENWVSSNGMIGFRNHTYVKVSYSLANWLIRGDQNYPYKYLNQNLYLKENYVEAAKIILDFIKTNNIKINSSLFKMAAILESQELIEQNECFSLINLYEIKDDMNHINSTIPLNTFLEQLIK